jgi:hypothetical protein
VNLRFNEEKARADKYAEALRGLRNKVTQYGDLVCAVCDSITVNWEDCEENHTPNCAKKQAEDEIKKG